MKSLRINCQLFLYHTIPFNSRPHEEVDLGRNVYKRTTEGFQFTTSRGGRPAKIAPEHCFFSLSIHDLTRRSTLLACYIQYLQSSFNSRPHEEVDKILPLLSVSVGAFQFTTSRGGRRFPLRISLIIGCFQFTTSRGGRQKLLYKKQDAIDFQFTTSRGGRRQTALSG